ncbi:MAG: VOC family protein [Clostridia bacterium]|nr:VOC family protein [Clostridia bacterium]NCC42053.1 VOC family protein [Clostridia bacterium]
MKLINGIHHVAMKCSNEEKYEEVINFYHEVLQLEILRTWDTGTMIKVGNEIIEVFNDAEDELPQGMIRHFALATDEVDACVEAVREAGYEITVEPKDIVIPSQPGFPARIAFCNGPLGEEIEFFQEK